ncbi:hypothetical protein Csa_017284 [Cucumis sativus]|uniref:Uncharacterized protein n=1 Tax=Cucumis sativus TaxID=3659 RepID=A0A0A0K679_CUCSA|nr:hypothetical protein Csa_017284 [Cucumis sativus]
MAEEIIDTCRYMVTTWFMDVSTSKHVKKAIETQQLYFELCTEMYIINIELVVDEIINHWVRKVEEEEEEDDETTREIDHQPQVMTAPTSDSDDVLESM